MYRTLRPQCGALSVCCEDIGELIYIAPISGVPYWVQTTLSWLAAEQWAQQDPTRGARHDFFSIGLYICLAPCRTDDHS